MRQLRAIEPALPEPPSSPLHEAPNAVAAAARMHAVAEAVEEVLWVERGPCGLHRPLAQRWRARTASSARR